MLPFDKWRRTGCKEWLRYRADGPVCCLIYNADKSELWRVEVNGSLGHSIIGSHPCDSLTVRASYVYFAATSTHIKIGQSYDVQMRLDYLRQSERGRCDLQIPDGLVSRDIRLIGHIAGDQKTEAIYHKQFAPYCVIGEWYRLDASLIDSIGSVDGIVLAK